MAKLTRKDIEDIVSTEMPGYKVIHHEPVEDAVAQRLVADEITPDLAELKQRLADRGRIAHDNPGPEAAAAEPDAIEADDDESEDHMVLLEPKASPSALDHGAKAKVVVISGKDRKIVTSQG